MLSTVPTDDKSEVTNSDFTCASDFLDQFISLSTEHHSDSSTPSTTNDADKKPLTTSSSFSRFRTIESLKRFSWNNTSPEHLIRAEMRIFETLKSSYQGRMVSVGDKDDFIWTIYSNSSSSNIPIVLLHGFGGGVGLWSLILDQLSADRPVYALDLPGFARSSRPTFSLDPFEAEQQFVDMIEQWRIEIKLNQPFILLGHSFGGFLATAYTIHYPTFVKQLVLIDPWGFAEKPEDMWQNQRLQRIPVWLRSISSVVMKFPPLVGLRAAGPLGIYVMKRVRADLRMKFEKLFNDDRIVEYLYHCNAQNPTGEEAFRTISDCLVWAKQPMIRRTEFLIADIPIYFLHGERSWIDSEPSSLILSKRPNTFVDIIEGAGHHVYADCPDEFESYLKRILTNKS